MTGGAGFIGSELVRELSRLGSTVYVLDNLSTGAKGKVSGYCSSLEVCNVTSINESSLNRLGTVDLVFHLAAPSSDVLFRENPIGCTTDTLVGFVEVMKFASKHNASKLIYPSSSSVYGASKPPQSEDTPTNPTNLYGAGKLICEAIAKLRPEIPSLGFRIFAGYGPGELPKGRIASVITIFMQSLINHTPITLFGDGSQTRDFVYIDDVVRSFVRGAEEPYTGVINLGSGEGCSFIQVVKDLESLLNIKGEVTFSPTPPGYFVSTMADITRLSSRLGVVPRSLSQGLAAYVKVVEKGQKF